MLPVCWGSPPPFFVSLYSPFIVVFLLLTGVPRVGTFPIRPYLQLLRVVVRTGEYGCVRHKALNTIKAAFPCTLLFYLSFFSTFVLSLPRETIWNFAIHGLLLLLPSAISIRGGFSMAEEGFFHGLGPWPSIDIQTGPLVFFPHTTLIPSRGMHGSNWIGLDRRFFNPTCVCPVEKFSIQPNPSHG